MAVFREIYAREIQNKNRAYIFEIKSWAIRDRAAGVDVLYVICWPKFMLNS